MEVKLKFDIISDIRFFGSKTYKFQLHLAGHNGPLGKVDRVQKHVEEDNKFKLLNGHAGVIPTYAWDKAIKRNQHTRVAIPILAQVKSDRQKLINPIRLSSLNDSIQ